MKDACESTMPLIMSTTTGFILLLIEQLLARSSCPANSISEYILHSVKSIRENITNIDAGPHPLPPPSSNLSATQI